MRCAAAAAVAFVALLATSASPAAADPDPVAPDVVAPVAVTTAPPAATPPVDDGKVASSPPATTTAPDGMKLSVSAKDETQLSVAPLTTALSTREYLVAGVFRASVKESESTPEGIFEVGYQIGCGIDLSSVALIGSAGGNASIGYFGLDFGQVLPDGLVPGVGVSVNGGLTVVLKPGEVTVAPVTKKKYTGSEPWVSISNFRVNVDGCVGESFIRSYATLAVSTDQGEAILSWYGVTKAM